MNGLNQNLTFVTENGNSTSGERVTWLLDYDSRKSRPASPKPIDLPFASIDEDELSLSILPQVPALTIATQLKFVQRLKDVINCPYTLPNASLLNFFIQLREMHNTSYSIQLIKFLQISIRFTSTGRYCIKPLGTRKSSIVSLYSFCNMIFFQE